MDAFAKAGKAGRRPALSWLVQKQFPNGKPTVTAKSGGNWCVHSLGGRSSKSKDCVPSVGSLRKKDENREFVWVCQDRAPPPQKKIDFAGSCWKPTLWVPSRLRKHLTPPLNSWSGHLEGSKSRRALEANEGFDSATKWVQLFGYNFSVGWLQLIASKSCCLLLAESTSFVHFGTQWLEDAIEDENSAFELEENKFNGDWLTTTEPPDGLPKLRSLAVQTPRLHCFDRFLGRSG